MSDKRKVTLLLGLMGLVAAWSTLCFRAEYTHAKRLRVVQPGKLYRSGQLTEAGFREAVRELGIRTIINLQDDVPDPKVWHNYLDRRTIKESEVCNELGVRYVWLSPDLLPMGETERRQPDVIAQFLDLMDQEETYPALIHCKAGLHRTGVLTAVYRMEYQDWSRQAAFLELRAHGFGDWVSTTANPYIEQYIFAYQRRDAKSTRMSAVGRGHSRVD